MANLIQLFALELIIIEIKQSYFIDEWLFYSCSIYFIFLSINDKFHLKVIIFER